MIRNVTVADASCIAAIYDFHARHGTASFETEGPSSEETAAKVERITGKEWPFLVAELDSQVVGYAYVTQFRDRPAYAFSCENSIYVDAELRGRGVGKALLQELCTRAEAYGFRQMLAVIGDGEEASVRVHAACDFTLAGRMTAVGWKKGRWLDTVYMQRTLGPGATEPPSTTTLR